MHNHCWFSLVGKKQKAEGDFLEWLCDRLARHPFSGDSIMVALFLAMWFTGKDPLPWCLSLAARAELRLKRPTSRDSCFKYSCNLQGTCSTICIYIYYELLHPCQDHSVSKLYPGNMMFELGTHPVGGIQVYHKAPCTHYRLFLINWNTICLGVLESSWKINVSEAIHQKTSDRRKLMFDLIAVFLVNLWISRMTLRPVHPWPIHQCSRVMLGGNPEKDCNSLLFTIILQCCWILEFDWSGCVD